MTAQIPLSAAGADLQAIERLGRVDDAKGLVISSVEPVLLSHTFDEPVSFSGGVLPGITAGLVRVRTSDGIVGIGETYAGYWGPEEIRRYVPVFAEVIVGRDASDIAGCWQACVDSVKGKRGWRNAVAVLSAIECALWDLCGKATGRPVHALLGGAVHASLPRYASGGLDASPDGIGAEMRTHRDNGFIAAKIRGGVSPDDDIHKAGIARAALGPDLGLAIDLVQGVHPHPFSAEEAIAVCRRLEEIDPLWVEEPCAMRDVDAYVAVRKAVSVPISGAESGVTLEAFTPLLDAGGLDIVQPDAGHAGGILETRKVAAYAERTDTSVAVHAWGCGALLMANYHVGFASPNTAWLEYPIQPNPLIEALLAEPLIVENGRVKPPTAAGLGVNLTPELEEQFPYRPGNQYRLGDFRDESARAVTGE